MRQVSLHVVVCNITSVGISGGYLKYLSETLPRLAMMPEITQLSNLCSPALLPTMRETIPSVIHQELSRDVASHADVVFLPSARVAASLASGHGPARVVMVQNMEPLLVPWEGNSAADRLRNAARYAHTRAAVRLADRVIALSEASATYLRDRWHVPADRIGLVRHGVETVPESHRAERPASLARPYILAVGSIRPARGLPEILQAYAILREGLPTAPDLVIAGGVTGSAERYLASLRDLSARLGIDDHIHWLGTVPPGQLATLFAEAVCFVTASHAEASPVTAVEAMAYGCRIVSTDLPPMPELFGDSALYFGQRSVSALSHAIRAVLAESPADRAHNVENARSRAAAHTWDVSARMTLTELLAAWKVRCAR